MVLPPRRARGFAPTLCIRSPLDDRSRPQARGRPRRAAAAWRLAPAPAAAVARRAALQRVGGRRGRRDRPLRHRHAPARLDGQPRARAGHGRAEGRARAPGRVHARALRPLRAGGDDRRARGVRAVDAPRPPAHDGQRRRPRSGRRAPPGDRTIGWRARGAAAPVGAGTARAVLRHRGDRAAGTRAAAGRPRGDRPRSMGGRAHAGPRALARVPVAARAAPAHLRRPPAGARLALLRLRLLARPRPRVPALAGSGRGARRAALPVRARAHVHRRPGPHRGQPRADRAAVGRPGGRAARGRGGDRVRRRPARVRRSDDADERELVAERDALLPAPPAGHRARRGRRREPGALEPGRVAPVRLRRAQTASPRATTVAVLRAPRLLLRVGAAERRFYPLLRGEIRRSRLRARRGARVGRSRGSGGLRRSPLCGRFNEHHRRGKGSRGASSSAAPSSPRPRTGVGSFAPASGSQRAHPGAARGWALSTRIVLVNRGHPSPGGRRPVTEDARSVHQGSRAGGRRHALRPPRLLPSMPWPRSAAGLGADENQPAAAVASAGAAALGGSAGAAAAAGSGSTGAAGVVGLVAAAGVEVVFFAAGFVDDGAAPLDVEVRFAARFGATATGAAVAALTGLGAAAGAASRTTTVRSCTTRCTTTLRTTFVVCATGWAAGRRPLCNNSNPGSSRPVKASITAPLARAGAGAAARRRRTRAARPPSRRRTRARVAIRSKGTKLRTRISKASVHASPRRTSHGTPAEGRWAGHQSRKTPAARPAAMTLERRLSSIVRGERGLLAHQHEDCPYPVDRHQGPELDRCRRTMGAMRIDEIYASSDRPVFSFEFFPPRTPEGEANLYLALAALRPLAPDFVSVTYGAGGSTRGKTPEIVSRIRPQIRLEAMAHLPCGGAPVDELRPTLDERSAGGSDNALARRGAPPQGQEEWTKTEGGLEYSREL